MNRLIVVSNRVQPPTSNGAANQGGLAVALSAALRKSHGIWFGWSGTETETYSGEVNFQTSEGVTTATVDLEPQDVDEYYNGYANRTLWPLFHERVDIAEFQRDFEGGYERVNQRFSEALSHLIEPEDLIWIHDYHLIPLGRSLRGQGVTNPMGFFLHTPWPPTRLLLSLPHHRELVESLFAYDVVGFQTQEWLDSFLHYAQHQLGANIGENGTISHKGKTISAISCPIGIDAAAFRKIATEGPALRKYASMMRSAEGRSIMLGVDRLDYSKGLQERFWGYEKFLKDHPHMEDQVFLLQIAPPSREDVKSYQEIRNQLDSLSGRINGEFASAEWVPIRYVNKGYSRNELAGIYRAARVCLVTPLRDGMNLVAKEYIAAQNEEDPGVLILSHFAGAAEQLKSALLVNPHSAEDLSDAIARALTIDREERVARWRELYESIQREDVNWWLDRFIAALTRSREDEAGVSEEAPSA